MASSRSCVTWMAVKPSRFCSALIFGAELHAHLGVEVGQRLVEKQELGLDRERPAERHALALSAGEIRDLAILEA